jgi:hypothetical protein
MRPEATDPPIAGRKDLIVNVEEKNTGNLMLGAGFSSVDALVGYAEISQGNFDLFHPPTFTGGGQKLRLFVQLGTERQDYELSFVEPWFLNRKLALGVDLYRHQLNFESPNNIYDETRTGVRLSLTRALWSDFFIGSVSYTLEDVGINLNSGIMDGKRAPPRCLRFHQTHRMPFWLKPAIVCTTASVSLLPTTRGTARDCRITASGRNLTRNSASATPRITNWNQEPPGISPACSRATCWRRSGAPVSRTV